MGQFVIFQTDPLPEFQLAFGHHRIEAARRLGLQSVPLVIRELADQQMLQYMGRENMEDYTSFSVLLETWEAGTNYLYYLSNTEVKDIEENYLAFQNANFKNLDVARLLGWMLVRASFCLAKM